MLARSILTWEAAAAAGEGRQMLAASYATQAYTSQSGRMKPQVERAIRIKSQSQKRAARQNFEERSSGPPYKNVTRSPRSDTRLDSGTGQKYRTDDAEGSFRYSQRSEPPRQRENPDFTSYANVTPAPHSDTKHQPGARQKTRHSQRPESPRQNQGFDSKEPSYPSNRVIQSESLRELRFDLTQKLKKLAQEREGSPDDLYAEGQKLFDSLSNLTAREPRLYNLMIRLAMKAAKRNSAIKLFNEVRRPRLRKLWLFD